MKSQLLQIFSLAGLLSLVNLELFPQQAALLGFAKALPSPKTVWHFEVVRLGLKGFRELFNETVWSIKMMLAGIGVVIARWISVDSTPIRACWNDKDELAKFNDHYKLWWTLQSIQPVKLAPP